MQAFQVEYQHEQGIRDTEQPTVYRALTLDATGRSLASDVMAGLHGRYMQGRNPNNQIEGNLEMMLRTLWEDAKHLISIKAVVDADFIERNVKHHAKNFNDINNGYYVRLKRDCRWTLNFKLTMPEHRKIEALLEYHVRFCSSSFEYESDNIMTWLNLGFSEEDEQEMKNTFRTKNNRFIEGTLKHIKTLGKPLVNVLVLADIQNDVEKWTKDMLETNKLGINYRMYVPVFERIRSLFDILLCNRWLNVARAPGHFTAYADTDINTVPGQNYELLLPYFIAYMKRIMLLGGKLLLYPNFAALRCADTLCRPFGPGDTTYMGLNADALAAHERAKSRVMWQAMVTHDGKLKQPVLPPIHHVANENLRGIHAYFVAWRLLKWPLA
jgi:hypothetical protein